MRKQTFLCITPGAVEPRKKREQCAVGSPANNVFVVLCDSLAKCLIGNGFSWTDFQVGKACHNNVLLRSYTFPKFPAVSYPET